MSRSPATAACARKGAADEATAHVADRWPHVRLWNASFTAAQDRLET
jgi:hypothetical protein